MGHHAQLGRKTNANHKHFAANAFLSNGGGYLAEIARIDKQSDPGPRRDEALEPLQKRANDHYEETLRWHRANVKAAQDYFLTQRPADIQRYAVHADSKKLQEATNWRTVLNGSRTEELEALAKSAAASRNCAQLFALRQEIAARVEKDDISAAHVIPVLNSAHFEQQRAALADALGAAHALAEHERCGVTGNRDDSVFDITKIRRTLDESTTFTNDQGESQTLTEWEAQPLWLQAGAIDEVTVTDSKAAGDPERLLKRLAGKLDFLKPVIVAGNGLAIAREAIAV